jgi:hypothetical protein
MIRGVIPYDIHADTGLYPEPDPDNLLQYEKVVPQALEKNVLAAMGWTTKSDVPQA